MLELPLCGALTLKRQEPLWEHQRAQAQEPIKNAQETGNALVFRPGANKQRALSMNLRQQKYKRNRIMGMNMYNAARAAGYSHSTARVAGQKCEKVCNIRDIMEQAGLTDRRIMDVMAEGLTAEKPVVVNKTLVYEPDNFVRLEYAKTAMKLKGLLVDKPLVDQSQHTHFNFTDIVRKANANSGADRAGSGGEHTLSRAQSCGIQQAGLGDESVVKASGNHELGEGQPEDNGPKQ